MRQDGCELFPDTRSNVASQEFDRAQHLLVGKGRDTHLKGDSRKTSENLVHVKYPLRHLFSSRDPHAMNSDSPGESEIISTHGPQLFGTFFAKDNIKRNGDRASRKDLLSPAARLRPVIHSKFAEAAPHAVLSQVPQDRTRVLFCTRWTGALSCRHLMQQPVELVPLARPQRM